MNDFFLASGRAFEFGAIKIHQIKMHNYDEWVQIAKPIKDLKKFDEDTLVEYIQNNVAKVVKLLSFSLNTSESEVIALKDKENIGLTDLLKITIEVNSAYFKERESKPRDDVDPRKASWFNSFQMLISNGHTHESVMQMTYGAFIGYLRSAERAERLKMLAMANATRVAQHAKDNGFKKFSESMSKN